MMSLVLFITMLGEHNAPRMVVIPVQDALQCQQLGNEAMLKSFNVASYSCQ